MREFPQMFLLELLRQFGAAEAEADIDADLGFIGVDAIDERRPAIWAAS